MGTNRIKKFLPKPEVEEDPTEPLATIDNPFEWLFKQALAQSQASPLHATEHPDHFEVTLEAPGYSKEELSLTLKNGVLLIGGKKSVSDGTNNSVSEIHYTITLGDGLDSDNIDASHKDGVLTIKVPKIEPDVKNIEIK